MYRNIESLYCALETNKALQVNYTSNKLIENEIIFVVTRGEGSGEEELGEGGQKVQTSIYKKNEC